MFNFICSNQDKNSNAQTMAYSIQVTGLSKFEIIKVHNKFTKWCRWNTTQNSKSITSQSILTLFSWFQMSFQRSKTLNGVIWCFPSWLLFWITNTNSNIKVSSSNSLTLTHDFWLMPKSRYLLVLALELPLPIAFLSAACICFSWLLFRRRDISFSLFS